MSRAEEARIAARATAPPSSPPVPTASAPGPYAIIAQNLDIAFGELDGHGARLKALEAALVGRGERALTSYRINAAKQLVVELGDGSEEVVGVLQGGQ